MNQVRGWLEALHDRRRRSEAAYQSRRTLLDQWADVCALRKELGTAEKQLDNLNRHHENSALGDSSATAEMLLFDHNKLLPEFRVKLNYNFTLKFFSLNYIHLVKWGFFHLVLFNIPLNVIQHSHSYRNPTCNPSFLLRRLYNSVAIASNTDILQLLLCDVKA